MRVLITISSCARDIQLGYNQVMRETWLPLLKDFPNVDYKFFVGSGKYEGYEPGIEETWTRDAWSRQVIPAAYKQAEKTFPSDIVLQDDEIMLDVPDGYKYLPLKTKQSHEYALKHDYDYVFQCFTDTYVIPRNLMDCGFEEHDYIGYAIKVDYKVFNYAHGGAGYWLSKKACEILVNFPISSWAEDVWAGEAMHNNGIRFEIDARYKNIYNGVVAFDSITQHLAAVEDYGKYYPNMMRDVHRKAQVVGGEFNDILSKIMLK